MARSMFHSLGGVWFFIIGAPLAAWFLIQFWIAPFIGLSYTINIQTILSFSNPSAILLFVALWFGLSLGYFGASLYSHKGHR
jgi:hypothetical protein